MVLGGCASRWVVERDIALPPRAPGLEAPQKIAILSFQGADSEGGLVINALRERVANSGLHTLVDLSLERERADHIERMLSSGNFAGIDSQWANILMRVGAGRAEYDHKTEESRSKRCVKWGRKSNCERYVDVPVYQLTERCHFEVRVQLMRTVDGVIVLEKVFRGLSNRRHSATRSPPEGDGPTTCRLAAGHAVDDIATHVVGENRHVRLKLFAAEGTDAQMPSVMEALRAGRFADAQKMLESLAKDPGLSSRDRARMRYNVALVSWAAGDRKTCSRELAQASANLDDEERLDWLRSECVN
jgi:hypothetical protein